MDFEVKYPILGFEDVSTMKLEKIDDVFMRLSNINGSSPVFVLINPFVLREYDFEVPSAIRLLLELENSKNMLVGNIMVTQNPIQNSTINFLAPVVFNLDNKTMAQVVLDSLRYPAYGIAEPISKWYNEEANDNDIDNNDKNNKEDSKDTTKQ